MKSHVFMVALLAAGCAANLPVATTTTSGGIINQPGGLNAPQGMQEGPPRVVVGDDAAAQIASVRCAHEDACGNVGATGSYPTFDECVIDVRVTNRRALTGADCAKGIDPYALQQCVEDTRAAACGETPETCDNDRMCR